jgi:AcrR family transcriptional regulator
MAIPETQRADARRNREKLLTAATELFAASGKDVSLDAVAKRAGVGIGTLYRHFPTRDALVEAAYRNEVAQLCEAAAELLADLVPDVALAEWMDRFVSYSTAKKGMRDALQSVVAGGSDLFGDARGQIVGAIALLLEAGVEAGTLRPDVDAEDVMRAMGAVWLVDDEDQARRLLRLLMDGLRHGTAGR